MKRFMVFLILPISASALAAEDNCRAILQDGFFNQYNSSTSQSREQALYAEMCSSSYEQAKNLASRAQSSGSGGNVGVSYGLFGLDAGATSSSASSLTESHFNEWKKTHCEKNSSADSSRAAEYIMQKTVSEAVVNAWTNCMVAREGLSCYAAPYDQEALLNISWKKTSLTQPEVTSSYLSKGAVSDFEGVMSGKLLPEKQKLYPGVLQIPVTRNKEKSLVANLNVIHDGVGYPCSFFVPGMKDFELKEPAIADSSIESPEIGCKAQAAPFGATCEGSWSYAAPKGYKVCLVQFKASSGPTAGSSIELRDASEEKGALYWKVVSNAEPFGAGRWVYGNMKVSYVGGDHDNLSDGTACSAKDLGSY